MSLRTLFWNATESRPRAAVRLVVGFLLIAVLAVVGSLIAELGVSALWDARTVSYVLLGSMLGLGLGATLGVVLVARFLDRRKLDDYGFRGGRAWWRDLAAGLGLAVGLQAAVLGVELEAGWVTVVATVSARADGFALALVATLALFVVVGVYEELVVRGFVLKNLAEGLSAYGRFRAVGAAVVGSSLLFGVVHLTNQGSSLVSMAGIAVIALTLAAGYVLTGRLGLPVGFHVGWNVAMGVLFGQPVSGFDVPARVLVVEVTGPAAWTGGEFGPEAGLLGVLAALVGLAVVVGYARVVEGAVRIHPAVLAPDLRTRRETAPATADVRDELPVNADGGTEQDVDVSAEE